MMRAMERIIRNKTIAVMMRTMRQIIRNKTIPAMMGLWNELDVLS